MTHNIGSVAWRDLTVENADAIRKFYEQVVGWQAEPHDMGEYHDFDILDESGEVVAGICHARGENANVPAAWLVYIVVDNVEKSCKRVKELGGEVLDGPRMMGKSPFAVIRDPAGAVAAIIEQ